MSEIKYRIAKEIDLPLLAEMNFQLIQDEGHRNPMNVPELENRMKIWLKTEYIAVIFESGNVDIGYVLYRHEPDWIYLRQFFIKKTMRRKGIGTEAIKWLLNNSWKNTRYIRVEALVENKKAIEFWRHVGFKDYCIILELEKVKVGLFHGRGTPSRLISSIQEEFGKDWEQIDIFIFGHSHYPCNKEINGKIYFNPGSPTDKVFTPYLSYGILDIKDKQIRRRIIKIE